MVRGHGCIDFDDSTDAKNMFSTLSERYKARAGLPEIAALAAFRMGALLFPRRLRLTCLELAKCLVDAKVKSFAMTSKSLMNWVASTRESFTLLAD